MQAEEAREVETDSRGQAKWEKWKGYQFKAPTPKHDVP